jgi:hypothetical protein
MTEKIIVAGKLINIFRGILNLSMKIPPPVHLFYMPPDRQFLPKEISKELGVVDPLWISIIGLENFANQVLENVRIKVNPNLKYQPVVQFNPNQSSSKYSHDESASEIIINKLDPKESVYIFLFPLPSEIDEFNKQPVVIIDKNLLTLPMQSYGFIRKNLLDSVFGFLIVISVISTGLFTGYTHWYTSKIISKAEERSKVIDQARSTFSEICSLDMITGDEIGQENIKQKNKLNEENLFRMNQVSDWVSLTKKPNVVICK